MKTKKGRRINKVKKWFKLDEPYVIYDKENPKHYTTVYEDSHTDGEVGRVIREHLQKFNLI